MISRVRVVAMAVAVVVMGGVAGVPAAGAEEPGASASSAPVPFVREKFELPGGKPAGNDLAVDPVSRQLYLAGDSTRGVSVFDTVTRRFKSSITIGGDRANLTSIAVDSGLGRALVLDDDDETISAIDVTTNTVIGRIPLLGPGETFRPQSITIDQTAHRAYVVNWDAAFLSVIDVKSLKVIGVIDEFGGIEDGSMAAGVDEALHKGYVSNGRSGVISVFDTRTGGSLASIAGGGMFPVDVDVDSFNHRAYVANAWSKTVTVIDTTHDVVVTTVAVGDEPVKVSVDPSTRLVYVSNNQDDTVSVIDGSVDRVITTFERSGPFGVGEHPSTTAIDPTTSTAYILAGFDAAIVVVGSGRVGESSIGRVAGADRYGTAAAVSRETYARGVPVAYVASGAAFPDALSGGAAAAKLGGPVLVTPSGVPEVVAAELDRLDPGRIVVLGGALAVGEAVVDALESYAPVVERVGGADRFAVSAAVSATTFAEHPAVAYVASGVTFPDALAGGAAAGRNGGPVLLVTKEGVPGPVAAELGRLKPERIVLLGGREAVSAAVEAELAAIAPTTRLAGADRFDVSAGISHEVFRAMQTDTVYIASGETFPDALAGAPAAVTDYAPVLLVRRDAVPAATAAELDRLRPSRIVVLGGPAAISDATMAELATHLR
ncbi:cell wall-binding repeat-containing protein [Herbiconiux sp. CPCC 205716]|uniref:Cell wall-binding repeat-containing protein n=1 Tax=Herbiconiux gentiana TaxID=2970912 RepID=A0ABT2GI99_9MICO|nr:cell wall-binding repeat-containing protein [Herbiconiux gentiana]MCS5715836.1 cell wall-binding repeat-containing protein [Herbiconiux gentiana]